MNTTKLMEKLNFPTKIVSEQCLFVNTQLMAGPPDITIEDMATSLASVKPELAQPQMTFDEKQTVCMGKMDVRHYTGVVGADSIIEDLHAWVRHYLRVCHHNGWASDKE